MDQVWTGDWRAKLTARLARFGCATVAEFLDKHPGESYVRVAERLGDNIAALQLELLQFDEAKSYYHIRQAAMDSLARELNYHLHDGWRQGAKADFDTASAYADWIVRIQQKSAELRPLAKAVWDALEASLPWQGWTPLGCHDELIASAFDKGWPLPEPNK